MSLGREKAEVIVGLRGGLGNQLFQIAFAMALRQQGKGRVSLDTRFLSPLRQNPFQSRRTLAIRRLRVGGRFDTKLTHSPPSMASLRRLDVNNGDANEVERSEGRYSVLLDPGNGYYPRLMKIERPLAYYWGYWQSHLYFDNLRPDLVQSFLPTEPKTDSAGELEEIIDGGVTVGVHVRRGDYVSNRRNLEAFGTCTREYYLEGMALLRDSLRAEQTLIFTDDPQWCLDNLGNHRSQRIVPRDISKRSDEEDLWLLSRCDGVVISNSTFGWWGAWLGNHGSQVVVPEHWYRGVESAWDHLLLQEWVRL